MNVKELTVSVSQKVNLGNFQSKGIGLGITVELNDKDDLFKTKQQCADKLNQMLDFEIRKIKVQNGKGAE
ncbi:MAG: hypothetical protein V1676_02740 [Candidatus Diapherotrites archaeon]